MMRICTSVQLLFATKFFVVVYIDVMRKKVDMDVKLILHYVYVHFVVHIKEGRPKL